MNLNLEVVVAILYFPPFIYMFRTHGKMITGVNRFLLICWAIESFILLFVTISGYYDASWEYGTQMFYWVTSEALFMLFVALMFKLKKLQIYMDKENTSSEQIRTQLNRLHFLAFLYAVWYMIIVAGDVLVEFNVLNEMTSTELYAWFYLILSIICLLIELTAHAYLIIMGFKMQSIFKEFGHTTSYRGETVMVVCYFLFLGTLIEHWIVMPMYVFRINTSDFECSRGEKLFLMTAHTWLFAFWPLSYQAIFFAVLLQLFSIQSKVDE